MTTVMKSVEAMLNHRFAVMPMDRSGFASAIASLVTSVRIPSLGVIRRLTAKPQATPAYAAASPASGCRPRL